jgi:hypothetical protein
VAIEEWKPSRGGRQGTEGSTSSVVAGAAASARFAIRSVHRYGLTTVVIPP